MAVTNKFSKSTLDLNGQASIGAATALEWGNDGRLYVVENGGGVNILTVQFGDKNPNDGDDEVGFYVSEAVELQLAVPNFNDDGTPNGNAARQTTGVAVSDQFDENGQQMFVQSDGSISTNVTDTPAVTFYVASSDSRTAGGSGGSDANLDTNSGVITKFTQTGENSWSQVDLVTGLPRSDENHATNGMPVIQEVDEVTGELISERMVVASGGNANTGAPSNNFSGQQEQPLSAAILEVDLSAINELYPPQDVNGRQVQYQLPTLDDPRQDGPDDLNDPRGGNDGRNSATLDYDDVVTIYSPGYRNSFDVLVTEDGRVWTYDNGANNNWGGRPIGEAEDGNLPNGTGSLDALLAQLPGYVATNLNNGEGQSSDTIALENWNPSNNDNFHEITRSDDLDGRDLSNAGNVATYTLDGLTYVYGGHPNPTRAEGAKAGLLFSPKSGTVDSFLLVSNQDSYNEDGDNNPNTGTDFDEVIAWLTAVEQNDADFPTQGIYGAEAGELTSRVLAVTPGIQYDIYELPDGSGVAVNPATDTPPQNGTLLGSAGLPADIASIVSDLNQIEGAYLEGGQQDGALDSGGGSINGLAEYTSTIFDGLLNDQGEEIDMSGAIVATEFDNNYLFMGRNDDGTMSTTFQGNNAKAAERTTLQTSGKPLGLDSLGDEDELAAKGLSQAFKGSLWAAAFNGQGFDIEILQPGDAEELPLLGSVDLYAGQVPTDPNDRDFDGLSKFVDPFEASPDNGYDLNAGERLFLDFIAEAPGGEQLFPGTIGGVGYLGAALDGPNSLAGPLADDATGAPTPNDFTTLNIQEAGATANQDAISGNYLDFGGNVAGDGNAQPEQQDGLFDLGGNLIAGANADNTQIKKVVPGTMVGVANTARDAVHTGVRIGDDVGRIEATVAASNWVANQNGALESQLSGMVFSDGTQSNFVRVVFGSVNGQDGFEVGVEVDDVYTVLAQVAVPELANSDNNNVDLRFSVSTETFEMQAFYRIGGAEPGDANFIKDQDFVEIPLSNAIVPEGVLRDVLLDQHTITDPISNVTAASGAAIGIVAESNETNLFTSAIDYFDIEIIAFGNEIDADTAAEVGQSGTTGDDTIIYTGTETTLPQLASDVENFDGTGSNANYNVTANDLDNVIRVGEGQNVITTGDGADRIIATGDQIDGDEITDFSEDDSILLTDKTFAQALNATYTAGSAGITIGGDTFTITDPAFDDFIAADGPSTFQFTETAEGVLVEIAPDITLVVAVNAGPQQPTFDLDGDGIAETTFLSDVNNAQAASYITPGSEGGGSSKTFSGAGQSAAVQAANYGDGALNELHWVERSSNPKYYGYEIPGLEDGTYQIDIYLAEIFHGVSNASLDPNDRVFDIIIEGETVEDNFDVAVATGGQALTEVKLTYVADVIDGAFTIDFDARASAGGIDQPKISGFALYQLGGTFVPPADTVAPEIQSISIENPNAPTDGVRLMTVVVTDAIGFDDATFTVDPAEVTFANIEPSSVTVDSTSISADGKTATVVYALGSPTDGGWPFSLDGEVTIAAGAYEDAAGNATAQVVEAFASTPGIDDLVRGDVVRAINVGTTDTSAATNLAADPLDGNTVDNDRYAGAITADSLITDAFGNPVEFEADDASYYTSPKSNGQLNANVDGQSTGQGSGSNAGGVDLDGSAYHTYRDSGAAQWTATYDGFANGVYIVELHFAELFHTSDNSRVGDFTINGVLNPELDNLDVHAAAGGDDTPYLVRVPVVVTDGQIVIDVDASGPGQAGYSAIVVYNAEDANLPPTLTIDDVTIAEGGDAVITVTRKGDATQEVNVDVAITGVTAAEGADFTAPGVTSLEFLPNEFTKTITIPTTDDDEAESAETIEVTLSNVTSDDGDAVIEKAVGVVTITANDQPFQAPVGSTIVELDFEVAGTDPLADGEFDSVLGPQATAYVPAQNPRYEDGQLKLNTSNGDLSQPADDASKNDFVKLVDLSDTTLDTIFITTAFDNPFQGQGVIPDYIQQGIVIAVTDPTLNQDANQFAKLIYGGNGGTATQVWYQGTATLPGLPVNQVPVVTATNGNPGPVANAAATPFGNDDIARVELSLQVNKIDGTLFQWVTYFADDGSILGGVRPAGTGEAGFLEVGPVQAPQPVLDAIDAGEVFVGVTSTDFNTGNPSFEANWDYLTVSSPQFVAGEELPTASISGPADVNEADGVAAYTVTLDEAPTEDTTVTVTIAPSGANPADVSEDVNADASIDGALTLDLVFQAGTTTLTQNIAVNLLDDTLPELDETYDVSLSGAGVKLNGSASVTTTIAANDEGLEVDSFNGVVADAGDFSDDGFNPTDLGELGVGNNVLIATQQGDNAAGGRERDYVTFEVPENHELTQIVLKRYVEPTSEQGGGGSNSQGFFAIDSGATLEWDPAVTPPDGSTIPVLGGHIYNGSDVNSLDPSNPNYAFFGIIDELGNSSSGETTQTIQFEGFPVNPDGTANLPAGQYTVWLNQGADTPGLVEVDFLVTPVAADLVAIADGPTIGEDGDSGDATLVFPLTGPADEQVLIDYTVDGIDQPTATVTFDASGEAALSVLVAKDDVDDGDDVVSVELTGVSGTDVALDVTATTATGTVTEDDLPDTTVLFRVNVGGPEVAALDDGPAWGADQGVFAPDSTTKSPFLVASTDANGIYNANAGSAHPGPVDVSDPSIPDTTPDAIFNTERWDAAAAPEMQWEFPIDAGTEVEVRLYFAELFGGVDAAGQRVFDIAVEDVVDPALDDIDQFAIAGPKGAFMRSVTTTVGDDGKLDIDLLHDVIENPALKGIEILQINDASGPQSRFVLDVAPEAGVQGVRDDLEPGDVFDVTLVLENEGPVDLAEWHIDFDPAVLQIQSVTVDAQGQLSNEIQAATFDNVAGTIDGAYGTSDAFPTGDLVIATFSVEVIGEGETALTFSEAAGRDTIATFAGNDLVGANSVGASVTSTAPDPVLIAVADASAVESGDAGTSTTLVFGLTTDDAAFAGDVAIAYTTDGGATTQTATVTFTDGAGDLTLTDIVPNDDDDNGSESVLLELLGTPETDAVEIDEAGASATGTVTEDDAPVGEAPVAVDDGATVLENTTLNIDVLSNDSDDATALDASSITAVSADGTPETAGQTAAGGTVSVNDDGTIAYTPAADDTGADSFVYELTDGDGNVVTATVNVDVTPPAGSSADEVVYRINANGSATQVVGAPDATDDSEPDWIGSQPIGNGAGPFTVTQGVTVAGGQDFGNDNTIGNASVPDDVDLTNVAGTDAAIEALYRSERFGNQQWSFDVEAGDYTVNLYFAEVFIGVQGSGADKGAGDRLFDVAIEGQQVLTNYDIFDTAGGGRIAVVESFDVTSDSTLNIDFTTIVDNAKINAIEIVKKGEAGAVTISVADAATGEAGDEGETALAFALTASDGAFSGDVTLDYTVDGAAQRSTVTFTDGAASLSVTVPNDDVDNGPESVALELIETVNTNAVEIDAAANTATGTVDEDDAAPVAAGDTDTTLANTALVLDVRANDTDADNTQDELTVTAAFFGETDGATEQGGTVTVTGDGEVTYTPPTDFTGLDTFSYEITDPAGQTAAATVTVSVTAPNVLSIADALSVTEGGDDALVSDTLLFPLTLTPALADGTVLTVAFTVDGGAEQTAAVTFDGAGAGVLPVDVAQDDVLSLEASAVTLTGVTGGLVSIDPFAAVAEGLVEEDDFAPIGSAPTDDLDQDGILNQDDEDIDGDGLVNDAPGVVGVDPFAYDASTTGQVLIQEDTVTLTFETEDGAAVTPYEAGFTGTLLSPKASTIEENLANAEVSGGSLNITASNGDHFNTNNTNQNAFVAGFSAPEGLSVETRFAIPDFDPSEEAPGRTAPVNFQAAGVVLGTDQDNLIKAVFGRTGNQIQVVQDNASGGGGAEFIQTTMPIDVSTASDIAIRLEVFLDEGVWKARAFATFYDDLGQAIAFDDDGDEATPLVTEFQVTDDAGGNDGQNEIIIKNGNQNNASNNATLLSKLEAGETMGAGVIQTSTNGQAQFDVSYEYLTVTALGERPNFPPTVVPLDAGTVGEDGAGVVVDLLAGAADPEGLTLDAGGLVLLDDNENSVAFTQDENTITIDPAQFADALGTGETVTVTGSFFVEDEAGNQTPNTLTLVVEGLDGPFVYYVDADQDGFGVDDEATNVTAYESPGEGFAEVAGDNDDGDDTVFPGAPEINDGKDNDQDGETDEDNQAPLAGADAYAIAQDGVLTVQASELLENDSDPDLDDLEVVGVTSVSGGIAELDGETGQVTFTAEDGFVGQASFTYDVSDGFGGTATGTVTVNVDAPTLISVGDVSALESGDDATATTLVFALTADDAAFNGAVLIDFQIDGGTPQQASFTFTNGASTLEVDVANDDAANGDETVTVTLLGTGSLDAVIDQAPGAASATGTVTEDDATPIVSGPTAIRVAEGGGVMALTTFAAADADSTPSFSLDQASLDAGFAIDAASGELTAPDFDFDAQSAYTVEVTASDGTNASTLTVTVNVDEADETPGTSDDVVEVEDGETLIVLDNDGEDNGGNDTVAATQGQLATETVVVSNFEQGDAFSVDVEGATILGFRAGSLIADLDYDGDGEKDGSIALNGSQFEGVDPDDLDAFFNDFQTVSENGTTTFVFAPVPDTDPIRIEAEDMPGVRDDGSIFYDENQGAASGGEVARLPGSATGTIELALADFGVEDGLFDLALAVFDENDGESTITVLLNGDEIASEVLDADGGGNAAQAANLRTLLIPGVDVPAGATLTITATADAGEFVRIDYLDVQPVQIVDPVNQAPQIAQVLGDLAITQGDSVSIDLGAFFSDPEERPLDFEVDSEFFAINQVDGAFLLEGLAGPADVTLAPVDVTVTATDDADQSVSQTFTFSVANVNDAPVAEGDIADQDWTVGEDVNVAIDLDALFSDADAALGLDTLTYTVEGLPQGVTFDEVNGALVGAPTGSGSFTVTITAEDEAGDQAQIVFSADVTGAVSADPIRIQAEDFDNIAAPGGFYVENQGAADGGQVIRLPKGQEDTASVNLTDKGVGAGTYTLALSIFDENDGQSPIQVYLDGALIGEDILDLDAGTNVASPSSRRLMEFGEVTVDENSVLEVFIDTQELEHGRLDWIELTPVGGDVTNFRPDVIPSFPDAITLEDPDFVIDLLQAFSDPEEDIIDFFIEGPDFLSINGSMLTGEDAPNGTYDVIVTAIDQGSGQPTERTLTLTVANTPDAPELDIPIADQIADEDTAFSFTLAEGTFIDEDGDDLALSATLADGSALPAWLTFDPDTATFSGTPGEADVDAGPITVKVIASDGDDATENAEAEFAITFTPANDRPVVTTPIADQSAVAGAAFAASLPENAFVDPEGDAVTYALVDEAGEPYAGWLSIDENTGDLSGTPGQDDLTGEAPLVVGVVASDAGGASAPSFVSITVSVDPATSDYALLGDLDGDGTLNFEDADIDEDGVLNEDDRAAYGDDAGVDLTAEGFVTLTAASQEVGDTPFDMGLRGVAPAFNGQVDELDYATNNGAQIIDTPDGKRLAFTAEKGMRTSPQAAFNTPVDTKGSDFAYSGVFDNPFADGAGETLEQFEEFGLLLTGADGSAVKLVFGAQGGQDGAVALNAYENKQTIEKFDAYALSQEDLTASDFAQITLSLTASVLADEVVFNAAFTLLDAAGEPIVTADLPGDKVITRDGEPGLFDALSGESGEPVYFGVVSTASNQGAADPFQVQVASLTITEEDFTPDQAGPTATVSIAELVNDQSDIVVTVTFTDETGVDEASVLDAAPELELVSDTAGPITAAPVVESLGGGVFTYTYAAPAEGWVGESFTATVLASTVLDTTPEQNANAGGESASVAAPDVDGPSAVVAVNSPADANAAIEVTVTYADPSGVDASTFDPTDVVLTSNASNEVVPAPSVADNGDGTVTYTFAAPAGGWVGNVFEASVAAGAVADLALNANVNAASDPIFVVIAGGGTPPETLLRINAFGPEVAAIDGGPDWQADLKDDLATTPNENSPYLDLVSTDPGQDRGDAQGYSGAGALPDGVPQAVIDTARSSNAPFSYNIPVADLDGNGDYTLTLHFAELFPGNQSAGSRVFDVTIEGQVIDILDDFDPSAGVGAGDVRTIEIPVTVSDGELNIAFAQDTVSGNDNPIINALEITTVGTTGGVDEDGPTASLNVTPPTTADDPIVVTVTFADDTALNESTINGDEIVFTSDDPTDPVGPINVGFQNNGDGTYTYAVVPPTGGWGGTNFSVGLAAGAVEDVFGNANDATTPIPIVLNGGGEEQVSLLRINAGGAQVAAPDGGPVWQSDIPVAGAGGSGDVATSSQYLQNAAGLGTQNRGDAGDYAPAAPEFADVLPDTVLDTARSGDVPFTYSIPVADLGGETDVEVRLYFAETFPTAARNFDVAVEGVVPAEFNDIIPNDAAGSFVLSFETTVTDGVLDLTFQQGVNNNPIINAIEILSQGPDDNGPTADLSVTPLESAEDDVVVTVTFADPTGVNASTIGGDEIGLTVNGASPLLADDFLNNGDGTYTYTFNAPVGGWGDGASLTAALLAGSVADVLGNQSAAGAPVAVNLPVNVGDALAILAGIPDAEIDTNGSYGDNAVGSVVLTVLDGSNNPQASNFGSNSFQLTNTGDKQVAAVVIDMRTAVYTDSVVDPDGAGGDNVAKNFAITSQGGTGAYVDLSDVYQFEGLDPLPNTTGSGQASNGGFRGVLIKFDGSQGGFTNGETVGFSGDMDPNSIAGLLKSTVDSGAINGWDVGGVGGSELIGSTFTVEFDDGSTAVGHLHSDESINGAIGEAVEGRSGNEVTLSVVTAGETVLSGETGQYGGAEPVITVNGPAGATVRVVLQKGFNPVTNNAGGAADLVQDRLDAARPEFAVNNNFDTQTVDVTLNGQGVAVIDAGDFDYNNADSGVSFAGSNVQPIALTAAVITPVTDNSPDVLAGDTNVAAGPVSAPVYLTNNGTPVDGPIDPGPVEGYFEGIEGNGNNFRFKMQIEDPNAGPNGGENPNGQWNFLDETDASTLGLMNGAFQGEGYYLWGSANNTSLNNVQGNSVLEFRIEIPEDELGTYTFRFRVGRDNDDTPAFPNDQQNDLWVNLVQESTGDEIEEFISIGNNEAEPINQGYVKLFGGPNNDNWGFASAVDGVPGNPTLQVDIQEAGFYTIEVAGRSQGYYVDYLELYKGSAPGVGASNSEFIVTGDTIPTFNGIGEQFVATGGDFSLNVSSAFSDQDGDDLELSAVSLPDGFSFNANTGVVSASNLAAGSYTVTIEAEDDDTNAVEGSFTVTVDDLPPQADFTATTLVNGDDIELGSSPGSSDLETDKVVQIRLTIPDNVTQVFSVSSAEVNWVSDRGHGGDADLTFQVVESLLPEEFGDDDFEEFVGSTTVTIDESWADDEFIEGVVDLADQINDLIDEEGPLEGGDTINLQLTGEGATRFIVQGTVEIDFEVDNGFATTSLIDPVDII